MKTLLSPRWSGLAAAFALMAMPSLLSAQDPSTTTTVTTTTTVAPSSPAPAQVQVESAQPTPVAVVPQPGEHVAEIELAVSRGSVQAYFGRAPRGEKAEIGGLELNIKLPSTATVTKLASRDKESEGAKKVTADNPWHATVTFSGAGRYVFNIVEWDNDPVVTAAVVKIDGVVVFSGRGRDEDIDNWPQKTYGQGVRKTGSREIAFLLAPQ